MSRTPKITDTLPETQAAFSELERLAAVKGIRFALAEYGAFRTAADTVDILGYRRDDYAVYVRRLNLSTPGATPVPIERWRRIAPFGASYHDFGAAFDIGITVKPATMTAAQALDVVGALAPQAGLRWGASFGDRPHFELAIALSTAAQFHKDYAAGTGHYAGQVPAAAVAEVAAAEQEISGVVDAVAEQANKLTGGLPPLATAFIAAASIGILGAIVARRLFL